MTELTYNPSGPAVQYKNLWVRIVLALVAAHLLVTFGKNISFLNAILQPFYYVSLAGSFVIAFILITVVHLVTGRLDKRFNWTEHLVQRAALQILFGIVMPCMLAYVMAWCYFAAFGINIKDTTYAYYEFPFVFVMLVCLNVYYLAYYFYLAHRIHLQSKQDAVRQGGSPVIAGENKITDKQVFIVNTPLKSIPLAIGQISYFFRQNESNFVRTTEKADYLVPQPLKDLEEQFPGFFRINRRMIISFQSVIEFRPGDHGKLEVFLRPEFNEQVTVSAENVSKFKEWMNR